MRIQRGNVRLLEEGKQAQIGPFKMLGCPTQGCYAANVREGSL